MADNKNMELNDEMMAKAAGGFGEPEDPKYGEGSRVHLKFSNDEGVVTTVVGTVIEMKSTPGGWQYKIQYDVNGTNYEHWYPEIAIED